MLASDLAGGRDGNPEHSPNYTIFRIGLWGHPNVKSSYRPSNYQVFGLKRSLPIL